MTRFLLTVIAAAIVAGGCTRDNGNAISSIPPRGDARPVQEARAPAPAPAAPAASRLLPPPGALDDAVITAKVSASLLADPAMAGADISVNTTQGVVSLTGVIDSQEQAATASAHAQRQDGVMRVDNHLTANLR